MHARSQSKKGRHAARLYSRKIAPPRFLGFGTAPPPLMYQVKTLPHFVLLTIRLTTHLSLLLHYVVSVGREPRGQAVGDARMRLFEGCVIRHSLIQHGARMTRI